jgi:hypothetical protein
MRRIARNRVRAKALRAGRSGRFLWLGWAVLATAMLLAAADLARAQGTLPPGSSQGGTTPPEMTAPTPAPRNDGQGGVITPPATHAPTAPGLVRPRGNVDPGMAVRPPPSQTYPTPVVPPPGTPGNAQPVVPK